mmetsp:Transcript_29198/g.75160  ORF Transcript_29198/g.75160 Transcript_29198/m.75160 type:complete len:696 (-) Transcript_29198:28-2115(-)
MSRRVHPDEEVEETKGRNVRFAAVADDEGVEDRRKESTKIEIQEPTAHFDQPEGDSKWTQSHARLLYLISSYAVAASSAEDEETWIRSVPLTVLMYEGVVAGALDFDYAPASVLVSQDGKSRRLWMNITQEGRSAIDDLREREFINGLKLSSEDFQPVTAYQVTRKGMEYVKRMPKHLRREVDDFTHAPPPHPRTLLQVSFDGENFIMHGGTFTRISEVSDIEDVSYVASPYLPRCLRAMEGKSLSSNAHRADESAMGKTNIRDELSEAINLGGLNVLVGEWVPFGSNQIVALNERLGSLDRCQGGMFTSVVDKTPTETKFSVPTGLTSVRIIDFDLVHYINFEAEINYPEDEGIVQIENFGMHLNVDGSVMYGMVVEAIADRQKDNLSLDLLSRLLVDVHQDSSKIMDDLLSEYQRALLNMIFTGDSLNRGKFNIVIAESIEPKLPADEYLDRGDYENELKQILGDIWEAHNLGRDDVLIIGREGLMLAGPSSKRHEKLLLQYCSILLREMFIRNFFTRTFILDDSLKKIRSLIQQYEKDPNNISKIRDMLNSASRDIILLKEVLSYLEESLETMSPPEVPKDEAGTLLFEVLNIEQLKADVDLRVRDLTKLIDGAQHEMMNLSQVTEVINTKQLEDVFKNVEANTKYLVDASAANEVQLKCAANNLDEMGGRETWGGWQYCRLCGCRRQLMGV